ncbi:hypothetical protein EZS27_039861 [termite gut metagenome]|uniref:Phage integrase SAM-like domain-containing protein n=1 Tax=termite gut metagenome TaxID=433724 RepID=A0A5J4PIW8_9ZZZZ
MRKYYSTGKNLSEEDWLKLPNTKSKTQIAIRTDIQNSFDKVKEVIQELEFGDGFSFDALNDHLGKSVLDTLNVAFENKIQILLENNQIGSHLYYKGALKSVERFAGNNIQFSSLTVDWLKRYEKHLLSLGNGYTTIGMNCRAIRCMINEARKAGIIKENQYPFGNGKYEIPTGQGRNMALTLQQIKSIVIYSDGRQATEKYRDM